MKKVLIFVTAMVLLAGVLAGCGGSQNELDFKSVRDTETGEIISLGDTKESVEKVLGAGVYDGELDYYTYLDDMISAQYNNENRLIFFSSKSTSNRFIFKDVDFNMKEEDLFDSYISKDLESIMAYEKFFDDKGNLVNDKTTANYSIMIFVDKEESDVEPNKISYISIYETGQ